MSFQVWCLSIGTILSFRRNQDGLSPHGQESPCLLNSLVAHRWQEDLHSCVQIAILPHSHSSTSYTCQHPVRHCMGRRLLQYEHRLRNACPTGATEDGEEA